MKALSLLEEETWETQRREKSKKSAGPKLDKGVRVEVLAAKSSE